MSWVDVAKRRQLLAAHPGISDAVLTHTDGILRVREGIRDASKLLAKEERYRAFTLFAMLAAERTLTGQPSIDFGEFYDLCTGRASISDRTAKTVAALLVHFRFATSAPDEKDRRRRSLVPTQRMETYFEAWGRPAYEALEQVGSPAGTGCLRMEMISVFADALRDYSASGLAFFQHDEDFQRVFALLEGGSLVCMSALSAAAHGRPAPSRSEIATRFLVSRAQVSRVVAEGRAAGFFTEQGAVVPTRRLHELYRECETTVLAFIDVQRDLTRERLRSETGAPSRSARG